MPRLSDQIAIGVLTRTFPPELVDRVITQTGRGEQRQRLLVEGLAWARRWQGSWQVPDKSSIARARARLGPAPLRALFVEVARPLATRKMKGAWYRGWRLVALDGNHPGRAGTVAHLPRNRRGVGVALPPGRQAGGAGSPCRRLLGKRARCQAGPRQARRGAGHRLPPGGSGPPWRAARVSAHHHDPGSRAGTRGRAAGAVSAAVGAGDRAGRARDPPARPPGVLLRSKDPDGSTRRSGRICWSTTPSAPSCTRPPWTPRSTLTGCRYPQPSLARRQVTSQAAFPPRRLARATRQAVAEALRHLLPPRRLHSLPRVVKHKMRNFALKRDPHRHWPQPTKRPDQAVVILTRTAPGP
jgi:hypothetical protein